MYAKLKRHLSIRGYTVAKEEDVFFTLHWLIFHCPSASLNSTKINFNKKERDLNIFSGIFCVICGGLSYETERE